VGVILDIARTLPADLQAAVLVVVHIPAQARSSLPHLLERAAGLPAEHARMGIPIESGHIYVAPPDFHMRVLDGRLSVDRGAHEHYNRPAIDPLFRSVASSYGSHAVGLLLSGVLNDGSAGLSAIKQAGGVAIIQDPDDARYPDMPAAAARALTVDYCLAAGEIGPLLARLASSLQ
jgi:two-component system chemotaxis response regulator CheB